MKLDTIGRSPHLPSRIADVIMARIVDGTLKPGDRLPTEHALSDSFRVSRNVVREAVARLRSEGVIQCRQGVGAFVVRKTSLSTLRIDAELFADNASYAHIFELRATIEIRAAGLAARRGEAENVERIADAHERMSAANVWTDACVDADLDFHRAIAAASGNPFIAQVVGFVYDQMRRSIIETQRRAEAATEIFDITICEHAAILDAIRSRHPEAAREAMATHIREACRRSGVPLDEED